jgi:hypothetical protein
MRHGSRDPRLVREDGDLGRFGLGLKTASLSQCRKLTVVSWKDGVLSGRRWDLDHVASRQNWMLLRLSEDQMRDLPLIEPLRTREHGTLILWEDFDRLVADGTSLERALGNRVALAREHLALVFHRFLSPPLGTRPVAISINRNPLRSVDPFQTSHKATQRLPVEDFTIGPDRVIVSPFILPHISKLSPSELELAGGEEGLRRNQGFYVYRNRRLISWGSWFRLVHQGELTKLARVQVDISNKLDHLWELDIKKSTTYLPESLRDGLRQIIHRITEGSRRVYTYRGRRTPDRIVHAWERIGDRDGVAYRINRNHPLLLAVTSSLPGEQAALFRELLQVLEDSIPFDAIYADMASEVRPATRALSDDAEGILTLAETILTTLGRDTDAGRRFLASISHTEPFCNVPNIAQTITQKLHLQ